MCVTVDFPSFLARCLSGAIPVDAVSVGDPSALHGADGGSVHEERARPCSGHSMPSVKRYSVAENEHFQSLEGVEKHEIHTIFLSVLRSGHRICSHLLHHVHLLQRRHHLGPLLPLQLLPGAAALAELQQHLEHAKLYQSCHQQQLLLHRKPRVLQVRVTAWEKSVLSYKTSLDYYQIIAQLQYQCVASQKAK